MDRKLLDILACPATRQPLSLLERPGLDALNAARANPPTMNGSTCQKTSRPRPLTEPTAQNR